MDQACSVFHLLAAEELGKETSASFQLPWDSLQVGKLDRCWAADLNKYPLPRTTLHPFKCV